MMPWATGSCVAVGLGGAERLVAEELRQREPDPAEQADVEELAAGRVAIKGIAGALVIHE